MGHDHDHSHSENYFLDQVCTVAVCGLLAGTGFLAWKVGLFSNYNILTDQFIFAMLLGSIALAGLVVVRGITLWKEAGSGRTHAHEHTHEHDHAHDHDHEHGEHRHHDHDHAHGESCGHDHPHEHDHQHDHDHDHAHGHDHHPHHHHGAPPAVDDHGHSHEFAPWRYAVMLLPLLLSGLLLYYSFMGLELKYSDDRLLVGALHNPELVGGSNEITNTSNQITPAGFRELSDAANNAQQREFWENRKTELTGLFAPMGEKQFTLFRRKMTCCASDSVPIKVRIISQENLKNYGLQPAKGVKVVGQIQFRKIKDSEEYIPVLLATDIKPAELGNDVFIRD